MKELFEDSELNVAKEFGSILPPEPEFANPHVDKQVMLYMEDVSVSFDGFKAINDLNMYIDAG